MDTSSTRKRSLLLSAPPAARSSPVHASLHADEAPSALGGRGFVVARGFLTSDELRALRLECDALSAATSASAIVRQGCVLDVLAQCLVRDDDAARVDKSAYLTARSAQLAKIASTTLRIGPDASPHAVVGDDPTLGANVIECLLFQRLPVAIAQLLDKSPSMEQPGDHSPLLNDVGSALFFFNEHYVVKPPASEVEFRWHRDDDEQLGMCVHRSDIAPYVSAWCALDDVTLDNGPLRFLPLDDPANDVADASSDSLKPCIGPEESQVAAFDANATAPLAAAAGDVIFFLSNVWHASSANETNTVRRAFYAQFSTEKITAGPRDPSPLSFAIPCIAAAQGSEDTGAEVVNVDRSSKRLRLSS